MVKGSGLKPLCHPERMLGAHRMCKPCYEKHLRHANPDYKEKQNQYRREWRARNAHRVDAKGSHRRFSLRRYGLTLTDYQRMYEAQKGKCAICLLEKPSGGREGLAVDHCHSTGKIRKLLCAQCNIGLGGFKDNIQNLYLAIHYLETNGQI